MMYADYTYYTDEYKGKLTDEDTINALLKQASRHIDTLTYRRILDDDFSNVSDYQKHIVQEACCMMADFEGANADMINSLLTSYSLNGASMSFSGVSANCFIVNGIIVQRDTYSYLEQSGLCCRSMGV